MKRLSVLAGALLIPLPLLATKVLVNGQWVELPPAPPPQPPPARQQQPPARGPQINANWANPRQSAAPARTSAVPQRIDPGAALANVLRSAPAASALRRDPLAPARAAAPANTYGSVPGDGVHLPALVYTAVQPEANNNVDVNNNNQYQPAPAAAAAAVARKQANNPPADNNNQHQPASAAVAVARKQVNNPPPVAAPAAYGALQLKPPPAEDAAQGQYRSTSDVIQPKPSPFASSTSAFYQGSSLVSQSAARADEANKKQVFLSTAGVRNERDLYAAPPTAIPGLPVPRGFAGNNNLDLNNNNVPDPNDNTRNRPSEQQPAAYAVAARKTTLPGLNEAPTVAARNPYQPAPAAAAVNRQQANAQADPSAYGDLQLKSNRPSLRRAPAQQQLSAAATSASPDLSAEMSPQWHATPPTVALLGQNAADSSTASTSQAHGPLRTDGTHAQPPRPRASTAAASTSTSAATNSFATNSGQPARGGLQYIGLTSEEARQQAAQRQGPGRVDPVVAADRRAREEQVRQEQERQQRGQQGGAELRRK